MTGQTGQTALVTAPEMVDPETGLVAGSDEETMPSVFQHEADPMWAGFTELACTTEETQTLTEAFDPQTEWDILPTGEVYVNHMRYRARLTRVFGATGWGMRPLEPMRFDRDTNTGYQRWAMYARGQVIGIATGSARYNDENRRMDYADTAESIKSNALTRICKDLSMGADLYDKRHQDMFRTEMCVQVWRRSEKRPMWRRTDSPPFYDETGAVGVAAPQESRPAEPQESRRAAPPRQSPAKDQPQGEVGDTFDFDDWSIDTVEQAKTGKTAKGRAWTLMRIKFTNDAREFWTFDTGIAERATAAKTDRVTVNGCAELKQSAKGIQSWHLTALEVFAAEDERQPPASDDVF